MPNEPPLKAQGLLFEGTSDIQALVLLKEVLPSWAEVHAVTKRECCYNWEDQMKLQDIW